MNANPMKLFMAGLMTVAISSAVADEMRVLPAGRFPADERLGPLRGEIGDFRFAPTESPSQWESRSEWVRRVMLVTMGLWPLPSKPPLDAVIHGRLDLGDYTVEKVYFQSVPGFYVTGSLYRPKGGRGRRPAVLSPHGHFPGGRFQDEGPDEVRRKIVTGAERFAEGGRSFMQSRCVQLARMGCVVFHYDMVGYADSVQIPLDVAHRFSRTRVKFKQPADEGLYSAHALLNLHNSLGLHTFNSIRALDFLLSLPDVDTERIAVTGGSGGGTQTFMLCAVDRRPLVSVPAVIVSTTRQGGCTCENICGLRIGTYNLEFTALHAPKPLLLISADDGTRQMAERGLPLLRAHYRSLGAEQHLAHTALLQFPHNYNHVSRSAMYQWLNRHLKLGLEEPIVERAYRRLNEEQLSVWNEEHPRPVGNEDLQARLWGWFERDAEKQITALVPHDAESLRRYREVVGSAWEVLIRKLPQNAEVRFETKRTDDLRHHQRCWGLLRYRTDEQHQAELPIVKLVPLESNGRAVVWVGTEGKMSLYRESGQLRREISDLLGRGTTMVGVDLLDQGEFRSAADTGRRNRNRWLEGEEGFGGWTYCYNLPTAARRVHDLLAVASWLRDDYAVSLVSLEGTAPWPAAAVALAPELFEGLAIDTHGFRFSDVRDIYGVNFLPGAAKYGDLPGLLALCAPKRLWVAGETSKGLEHVRSAYSAAAAGGNLVTDNRSLAEFLGSEGE